MGFSQRRKAWEEPRKVLNEIQARQAKEAKEAGMTLEEYKKKLERDYAGWDIPRK